MSTAVSPRERLAGLDLPPIAQAEVAGLFHSAFWAERDRFGQQTWTPQGRQWRRDQCQNSLLRFALTYFVPSLRDQKTGMISIAPGHIELIRILQRFRTEDEPRWGFVGDRGLGKSTLTRIAIAWWLAYGHRQSVMLFSRTDPQAKKHFVRAANVFLGLRPSISVPLLADFPELVPVKGAGPGRLRLAGGGMLSAASIASSTEGENADDIRPDALIGDDLQTGAGKAKPSEWATLKERLNSVTPMGAAGRTGVLLLGTAYEVGDLGHDIVMKARGEECRSDDEGAWLAEFRCHYAEPDWPARGWTPQWRAAQIAKAKAAGGGALKAYAQEHEPHLLAAAEVQNATYWHEATHVMVSRFAVETDPEQIAWRAASVISVDHAVSEGRKADATAIGWLTRSPDARQSCLEYCEQGPSDPDKIMNRIWAIWEACPEDRKPTLLLYERVNGGTALAGQFKQGLPGNMRLYHRTEKDGTKTPGYLVRANKADRISALHSDAAAGRLVLLSNGRGIKLFKRQAEAWRPDLSGPAVDDLLDMASAAVRYFQTGDPEM